MTEPMERAPPPSKWVRSLASCMNVRACPGHAYDPTPAEHIANTISHGIGIVTSLTYFYRMVSVSHRELQYNIVLIYGSFTTLLFLMSTVYHYYEMLYRDQKKKARLRYYLHISDRTTIYLFIAASYTPWLTLRHCGFPGLNMKVLTWVFAILGMLYQWNFHEKYKKVELFIYIVVATCPSLVIITMNDRTGLDLMLLGGIVYVIGVVFFKLDGVVPFAHTIWHLHVLVAASLHSHAVLTTLLGPDANNPLPA